MSRLDRGLAAVSLGPLRSNPMECLPSARRTLSSGSSGRLCVGDCSLAAFFEGLRRGEGLFSRRDVGVVAGRDLRVDLNTVTLSRTT